MERQQGMSLLIAMSFLLILAVAGCSQQGADSLTLEKTANGLTVILKTNSYPGNNPVLVMLKDENGNPVTDAKVSGKLLMPDMPMAGYPMTIEFQREEGGSYSGLAQVSMDGLWRIELSIITPRGTLDPIGFNMTLEPK